MAKKQVIRLTEGDLHNIIKESVNKVLKEAADRFDPSDWTSNEYGEPTVWQYDDNKHYNWRESEAEDIMNGDYDDEILTNWDDFYNKLDDDNGWDSTLKDAAYKRKEILTKKWDTEIKKGNCDEEILNNWDEFYRNLPDYNAQNAAKKRKEFLDLIFNNNLSTDWKSYTNNPAFWDKFWRDDTVNESIWNSPSDWKNEGEEIDSLLNLIFSNKYKTPKGVKEMLIKILNTKNSEKLEELFWEIPLYKQFKNYRGLMQRLIVRQRTKLDSNYALSRLERPSAVFNDKSYHGPNVDFFDGDEKDDEMWGDNNKRIRRLDNFINGKNINNKKIERAVADNVIKHEFGGRDPRKEKLHTKGSANRDLIAMDKAKK